MVELISLFVFGSVAFFTVAVLYPAMSKRDAVRERVEKLIDEEVERPTLVQTPNKWQLFLADLGTKLQMKPSDLRTYREMITSSGFKTNSVYIFLGSKLLLTLALPAAYLLLFALPRGEVASNTSLLVAVACAITGYLLPTFWLTRRSENRKEEIFHSLPDVIDLLTTCVEAGLSLDAALIKTVDNFQHKDNPLIKEINTVILEVRAGKPRAEALKGLAERTMVDDIRAFVSMLVQTEKFGTSLGRTLRTYSDSLRIKRRQYAEERAAKTAIKMLFPLTFCIFPAILVVLLTPALFRIFMMFKKM